MRWLGGVNPFLIPPPATAAIGGVPSRGERRPSAGQPAMPRNSVPHRPRPRPCRCPPLGHLQPIRPSTVASGKHLQITAPTRTRPAHRSRRAHSFASCCPVEDEMHARARARTGTERGSEGWGAERRIDPGGAGGGRSMDLGCARGGAAGACHGRAGGLSVRSIPTSRVGSTGHGRMDPRPARLHHCMRLRPTATGRRRRRRVCVDALCRGRSGPGQGGAGEIGGGGGHWPCGGGGARWEPKPKASPQRQQGA